MSVTHRVSTLATVALVSVVAFLIGGCGSGLLAGSGPISSPLSEPSAVTGASAPPSASEIATGDPVPNELHGRWMGSHRDVPGINPLGGTTILLTEGVLTMTASAPADRPLLTSTVSTTGDGQLRLQSTTLGCRVGDIGLYSYSLSASGRSLTITGERDDCATRYAAVPGVWWKMGCKDPNALCLGDLDAGTYGSQYIAPRLDPGAEWEPIFGALGYTVLDGWANYTEGPTEFALTLSTDHATATPDNLNPTTQIFVFTQPTAASQAPPCTGEPDGGVERTVDGLMAWLQNVPGLVATTPTALTVDGRPGQWTDLRIDSGWSKGCEDTAPLVAYLTGGYQAGIAGLDRQRLILLDLGDGDLVAVQVHSTDPSRFDALVAEAMPIIESFRFE